MFPDKKWSIGGLKLTTQVLLFDVLGSGRPRTVQTVPVLSFFYQRFQCTKTPVFVRIPNKYWSLKMFPNLGNILSNRFGQCFLFSRKDLIKSLSSVLIPTIDI